MAINTDFRPLNQNMFNSDKMQINMQSCSDTVTANSVKNIDLLMTDDHLLQGVEKLLVYGSDKDDKITLQIIHPTFGVVNQFCTNFFINPSKTDQDISIPSYVAKIPAGLTIRLVYMASSFLGTRDVKINWLLHKVLT